MDDYPRREWKFHPTNLDLLHILHDHLHTVNIREMFDTLVGDPSEPNTKFVLVKEPTKVCSSQIDRNVGDFYWKNTGHNFDIQEVCSSQIDRNVGDFYWKNTGHNFDIQEAGDALTGTGKSFKLIRKKGVPKPDEAMMKFNMVVYSLNPPIPLQHKNEVLCKLTKLSSDEDVIFGEFIAFFLCCIRVSDATQFFNTRRCNLWGSSSTPEDAILGSSSFFLCRIRVSDGR
ncbi:hypothetical protein R3W88_000126 [Solanum pinnatisectum]|uniref:Uncharacterized protein n=1 Tax=Solanum pinnatisectum TaxID=50273 RepID=A0AAV9MHA4_9SOLN|nr:hypothetical protein R3W88_000126 [Solanum pinnatisectum]